MLGLFRSQKDVRNDTEIQTSRKKQLYVLTHLFENRRCADCDAPGPEWVSVTIGIFICSSCASIHRLLGPKISRVKALNRDQWEEAEILNLKEVGNTVAKSIYEKHVPRYYRRCKNGDPVVLKEEWIRAKYERKEFMKQPEGLSFFKKGFLEGYLWKRGKLDSQYNRRKFILTQDNGVFILKYFNDNAEVTPKAVFKITEVNATFSPNRVHPNGLHIMHESRRNSNTMTRNIFVYSDTGKEIVDWYMAIRAAKLHSLMVAFPSTNPKELAKNLTRDFVFEGYLYKTGPNPNSAYQRRYFMLDDRKLMYFSDPMDSHPKGEIVIGEKCDGFAVKGRIPSGFSDRGYGFILICPGRTWLLSADTEREREAWLRVLTGVIYGTPTQ